MERTGERERQETLGDDRGRGRTRKGGKGREDKTGLESLGEIEG